MTAMPPVPDVIVAVMSRMRAFCGARHIYDALRGEGQPVGVATQEWRAE